MATSILITPQPKRTSQKRENWTHLALKTPESSADRHQLPALRSNASQRTCSPEATHASTRLWSLSLVTRESRELDGPLIEDVEGEQVSDVRVGRGVDGVEGSVVVAAAL